MESLPDLHKADPAISTYLDEVTRIHCDVLHADLIALYLHGSMVQDDFNPDSSDLDILGVVAGATNFEQREELLVRLSHAALPVPAFGLELIICTSEAVRAPIEAMPYDFALSTGGEWGVQVETDGLTSDILVHMQLCRQAGLALMGPPAPDILAKIPATDLRAGLLGELIWHRGELLKDPQCKSITDAVLNAARSLYAAETGQIVSKTQGGKWWLARVPKDEVVALALDYRSGRSATLPSVRSARNFVELAIATL
ncbi:MAG: aminoglycoside adenylyltransferase domain-containing protein [Pseudomonadota bacterium]